jgi:hypothetical protein
MKMVCNGRFVATTTTPFDFFFCAMRSEDTNNNKKKRFELCMKLCEICFHFCQFEHTSTTLHKKDRPVFFGARMSQKILTGSGKTFICINGNIGAKMRTMRCIRF